jgi:diguanylate cyclase (GGDEF)-like protein
MQFRDVKLLGQIDGALAEHPVRPHSLGFELTESMVMQDAEATTSMLSALKTRRFLLHLDDFGTGYSSLSCLHRFPIDTLKVDRSFVMGLGKEGESLEITRAIVTLAHSLGLTVTAEGIETAVQMKHVGLLDCEFGQGYLFGKPVDVEEATSLLVSGHRAAVREKTVAAKGDPEGEGRVLVIDDDPANRQLLRLELEEGGFRVETAESGEEGLRKALHWAPEVILLDIRMPGLDGIETCRRLKEVAETASIPVVFVTGYEDDDEAAVGALSAGGNDFLSKDYSPPILLARVRCQVSICRAQDKLRRMAMTDELTGVFSRRYLFDSLRQAVKSMSRRKTVGLSCLLLDVDRFKRINDTLGHIAGDGVLKKIADTIVRSTRETDQVARFGGEEFVIVLPDTDLEGATVAAEKIRAAVERDCPSITVSIGLAHLPAVTPADLKETDNVDRLVQALLRRADTAMYAAKEQGRNRVVIAKEAS